MVTIFERTGKAFIIGAGYVVAVSDYHQQNWHLCIHFIVTYLVLNQVTNEEKYENWSCDSAGRMLAYVLCIRPLVSSPAPHKTQCHGACLIPSIQKVKAGGLQVQGHPRLNSKYEANLTYM